MHGVLVLWFLDAESEILMGGRIACLFSIIQFPSLSDDQQVCLWGNVYMCIQKKIDLMCKKDLFQ